MEKNLNGAAPVATPKNVRTVRPESVALITSSTSLEGLFLAAAQAVAAENPKDGAALAMVGMAYQDLKGMMLAAQAASMMRAEAAAARDSAETAATEARDKREAAEHELRMARYTMQAG